MNGPYVHQSIGKVERHHRHIINTTLPLLKHAGIPTLYWDFAIMTESHVYNKIPSSILDGISLFEKLCRKVPKHGNLRIFGCEAFPCLMPYYKNKLVGKSAPHLFLGYQATIDRYIYLDVESSRTIMFCD